MKSEKRFLLICSTYMRLIMTKHTHSSHSGIELEKENKELKNVIWNLHNRFNDIEELSNKLWLENEKLDHLHRKSDFWFAKGLVEEELNKKDDKCGTFSFSEIVTFGTGKLS
jgi:hypothetical protein